MVESELKKIHVEKVENPKQVAEYLGNIIPVYTFFSPADWSRDPPAGPLAEVTEVIIHNACDLYGTITVDDGLTLHYLFKRSHAESVKTLPGDQLLLTGPDGSIYADDGVAIWVNLRDAAKTNEQVKEDIKDEERKLIFFSVFNDEFNSLQQEVVKGDFGSVTVKFIVHYDGVAVKFEVILLKSSISSSEEEEEVMKTESEIYGKLSVHSDHNGVNGDALDGGSVIFNNTSNDEPICVSHGQPIPLLRSVVAVPERNNFVTLYADMSIDHTVTRWIAKFNPQPSSSSQMQLGNILVKLTWM